MNIPISCRRFSSSFVSFVCFVVSILLPGFVFAAAPADFDATRDVISAPIPTPRPAEVRLDAAVCAATRPGFPDLRLFDAAGTEWPRAIEPLYTTQPRTRRHPVAARANELRELPENRIETRLDIIQGDPAPDGLEIRTPLRDFIRTVRVSGSEDGTNWQLLAETEIFDYSRYMDIRRTEIPLPKNTFRRFAVEIGNASEERAQPLIRLVQANGQDQSRAFDLLQTAFRIDGVAFWRETTIMEKDQPVLQDWPHAGMEVAQNADDKTTEVTLNTRRAPVTRLVLATPVRNFQRGVSVQIPVLAAGRTQWRTIADGSLARVDLPGYSRNDVEIQFPEQRVEQLRLVIRNADNPTLEIANVLPRGPVYRLLWLAEPGAAYRLAYGSEAVDTPDYDLFAIRTALEKGIPPELGKLGEPAAAAPAGKSFSLGEFLSRPLVFGAFLVLAALAMLGFLAKALKRAR